MTSIFVGNLPYDATEADLRRPFEQHGRVSSVQIMTDDSQRSRGFAFVRMPSFEDAEEAIQRLSGMSMDGRQLTINEAEGSRGNPSGQSRGPSARDTAIAMFDSLCDDQNP